MIQEEWITDESAPSLTFQYFDNWSFNVGWNYVHESNSTLSTGLTLKPNKKMDTDLLSGV